MGRKRNFTDEQLEVAKAQIMKEVRMTSPRYRRLGTGNKLPVEEMGAWRAAIRELVKDWKIVKDSIKRGRYRLFLGDTPEEEKSEKSEKVESPEEGYKELFKTLVVEESEDVKELIDDAIALLQSARETVTIPNRDADILSAIMQTRNATGLMEKITGKKNEDD